METNRDKLNKLTNEELANAMWILYFRPMFWVEGSFAAQHSTPSEFRIAEWLGEEYNANDKFWRYFSGEDLDKNE